MSPEDSILGESSLLPFSYSFADPFCGIRQDELHIEGQAVFYGNGGGVLVVKSILCPKSSAQFFSNYLYQ